MNQLLKKVLVFGLVSSTSLTSYALLNDKVSSNQNIEMMSMKSKSQNHSNIKALKMNMPMISSAKSSFKPFIAKKIFVFSKMKLAKYR